jgi:hypothetical protein
VINDDECEAVGEMRIGRGNRSTGRKPTLAAHCPPQIPHDLSVNLRQSTGYRIFVVTTMRTQIKQHYDGFSENGFVTN